MGRCKALRRFPHVLHVPESVSCFSEPASSGCCSYNRYLGCRSIAVIILATLSTCDTSFINSEPQVTIQAQPKKAFDKSCLIETFKITSGNIAECLGHCLENCACQSFQICENTKCQLCSSNKEDNSSLLHENDDCIYAVYKTRPLQETNGQCSSNCFMKYNCCQQSGLCPKNKICKPLNSLEQPWKRFTCACPDGYHGDNCEKRMTSCQGYSDGARKRGKYKVLDSAGSVYEVYCHFDSVVAWTLVQSYSFANRGLDQFAKPLSEDSPVSENAVTWSGYRLSKERMSLVYESATLLRFTCDFEKPGEVEASDYVQVALDSQ